MHSFILSLAAALGGIAVILGAFAAHKLKGLLDTTQLHAFETGVKYHFIHVLAIFIAIWISEKFPGPLPVWAAKSFLLGIFLFSGSLYLLSTKSILGIESWKFLGPITPLGGLFFILGWLLLCVGIAKSS